MRSPMCVDRRRVELDRAGHRHGEHAVLAAPTARRARGGCGRSRGMRCFSISSSRKLVSSGSASLQRRARARPLLLGREVRREEEDLEVVARVDRVGELAELLVHDVEAARARGPPRAAPGRRRRRSPPRRPLVLRGQHREVELAERLLDEAALVVGGQRLARDLLGREDRQVRDLVADLRRSRDASRPRCRGGSARAAARGARAPRRWPRAPASSAVRRARATISSACSRASFSRSRYSARSSSASWRVRSAVSIESSIAFWRWSRAGADRRERELGEQEHRDPEHEQRPDHQPPGGGDQELPG